MFLFRLALAIGRTVGELEQSLGAGELVEWMAYYALEPWGQRVSDYQQAVTAAVVANANRGRGRVIKPEDLLVTADRDDNTVRGAEMFAALKQHLGMTHANT